MNDTLKAKLETIVELVNKASVDPDIEIEYCIPEVSTTADACDVDGTPYILIKYELSATITKTRKINLNEGVMESSAEEIANQVTFAIEEFKSEVEAGQIN